MARRQSRLMLRRVLWFDAATCVVTGVGLFALGGVLEELLAIPAGLSRAAGVLLLSFAAEVAYVARRGAPPRRAVWAIVGTNVLWAVASIVALVAGWLEPNTLGTAFVIAQAAAVAVIADVQVMGLRRMSVAVTS